MARGMVKIKFKMVSLNKNKSDKNSIMYRLVESELGQIGGWLAVSTGIGTGVVELVSKWHFDDTLQIFLSVGGIIFLCFKINHTRMEIKIKKQELERLKKENKDG